MPSSHSRHRIEIPVTLYEQLTTEAHRHHMTVAALATYLLSTAFAQPPTDESPAAMVEPRSFAEIQHTTHEIRVVPKKITGRPQSKPGSGEFGA